MKFTDCNQSNAMEDLILNVKEQEIMKRYKCKLQSKYKVTILMPEVDDSSASTDLIFASISGKKRNIEKVKHFLSERVKMNENRSASNVPVITLCDSDDEELPHVDFKDDSVYIIDSIMETEKFPVPSSNSTDDSVCIIESSFTQENTNFLNKRRKSGDPEINLPSSIDNSEICEVTSTTDEPAFKKEKFCEDKPKRPCLSPAPDFLPLFIPAKPKQKCKVTVSSGPTGSSAAASNDDIIVLDESNTEKPAAPRKLRPIIIDGCNVARSHGIRTKTFSAQGIKICVDYFLNRGHTEVTCFVPLYRRHADHFKTFPTTNPEILEDLAKKQIVVFTPSRRINGRRITSYDDRFIVQFASDKGGIIVSNDFYTDLVDEKESFKETIEQRLLQFLFVNDTFMVPDDPLGRDGPTLDEFLCFPPEDS